MEQENAMIAQATEMLNKGYDLAMGWLLSPAAWVQFALLVGAYFVAVIVTRFVTPRLARLLTPSEENLSILAKAMRFVLMFLPLLLPSFPMVSRRWVNRSRGRPLGRAR